MWEVLSDGVPFTAKYATFVHETLWRGRSNLEQIGHVIPEHLVDAS